MNKDFQEINEMINSRRMVIVKRKIVEIEEKFQKLQNFYDEIKNLCREQGKSNMINKESLERLIKEYENES